MAVPKITYEPIGTIQTCFQEKFGIPRQPGLSEKATGIIRLNEHPHFELAIKGLEGFSHLWVIFDFHKHDAKAWKPSIRPPRLGGNRKVGVLASRSPHRPNPIGLSVVKLDKVVILKGNKKGPLVELHVSGVDILDGTPVLDIKPYLPYADSLPDANAGWAAEPIERHPVIFSEKALKKIETIFVSEKKDLRVLIQEILELDPRPAFQKRKLPPSDPKSLGSRFGIWISDYDVKWQIAPTGFEVLDLVGRNES